MRPVILLDMSYAFLGLGGTIFFSLLQGALVFALAYFVARTLGSTHWLAKMALVLSSWLVWVVGGMFVWALLGGGFGFFEGGVPLMIVLPTGIYGAIVAAVLWIANDKAKLEADNVRR